MAKENKKNPPAPAVDTGTTGGNANTEVEKLQAWQHQKEYGEQLTAAQEKETIQNAINGVAKTLVESKKKNKKKQPKYSIAISEDKREITITHRPRVVKTLLTQHRELTLTKRHAMVFYCAAQTALTDAQIEKIVSDIQKIASELPALRIAKKYATKIAL